MIDGFHRPEHQFLSNFYELRQGFWIPIRNPRTGFRLLLPTAEHAYQCCKFLDDQDREKVAACKYAGQAKKLGKNVTLRLREDWDQVKVEIMEWIVRRKFKDPQLAELLVLTGDELIQESNWWGDSHWGVVTKIGGRPCIPYGDNHLGLILMKIREELKRG